MFFGFPLYVDHDAFMHRALLVLDAPVLRGRYTNNSITLQIFSLSFASVCPPNQFQCPESDICLLDFEVCDSINNCGDWSDEMNCGK